MKFLLIVASALFLAACSPSGQSASGNKPEARAVDYDQGLPIPGGRRGSI